jgi:hypothetical protein
MSPPNGGDAHRDRAREEWRVAALRWADAEDVAARAEGGRSIMLGELITTLLEQQRGLSKVDADRMARTSSAFKAYEDAMYAARHEANKFKIQMSNLDRIYWRLVSDEATARSERKMG